MPRRLGVSSNEKRNLRVESGTYAVPPKVHFQTIYCTFLLHPGGLFVHVCSLCQRLREETRCECEEIAWRTWRFFRTSVKLQQKIRCLQMETKNTKQVTNSYLILVESPGDQSFTPRFQVSHLALSYGCKKSDRSVSDVLTKNTTKHTSTFKKNHTTPVYQVGPVQPFSIQALDLMFHVSAQGSHLKTWRSCFGSKKTVLLKNNLKKPKKGALTWHNSKSQVRLKNKQTTSGPNFFWLIYL